MRSVTASTNRDSLSRGFKAPPLGSAATWATSVACRDFLPPLPRRGSRIIRVLSPPGTSFALRSRGGSKKGPDAKMTAVPARFLLPAPDRPVPHRSLTLAQADPELWAAILAENQRQEDHIELIASENYASKAVMAAQGSQLTNKYAEGYPGKRYYGGCDYVDVAEQLAIDRVKELFGAEAANVQPHSGAQANQAVFFAALKPGDTILGMSLPHGGHLTHGSPVNISGKWFRVVPYGLHAETELIDYDAAERLAHEHKPKLIIAGASAYSRIIDWERFRAIADSVDAVLMVDMAHYAGLIAADIYPSPVGIADFVTSTTHKTLRGPRGGFVLTTAAHRSEEHTSELQSRRDLVCRLLLEKKKKK